MMNLIKTLLRSLAFVRAVAESSLEDAGEGVKIHNGRSELDRITDVDPDPG